MKVLVVSVHPDDETLGCGGTLLKHQQQGDELYWLIITEPATESGYTRDFQEKRKIEVAGVAEAYAFKKMFQLGFPSARLHAIDFGLMLDKVAAVIQEVKPEILYMVNRTDVHTDHQVAARVLVSATKSFRNPFLKKILMYECLSETEMVPALPENIFMPQVYSDITPFLERKLEIMQLYESELALPPFPRSLENIKALARFRGSTILVDYAEAFMLVREIV